MANDTTEPQNNGAETDNVSGAKTDNTTGANDQLPPSFVQEVFDTKSSDSSGDCADHTDTANDDNNAPSSDCECAAEGTPADDTDGNSSDDAQDTDDDAEAHESWWKRWNKKGHPFIIIFIAVVVLAALSLVPWGQLTGNFLKDFNLLSDLMPEQNDSTLESTAMLDPALEAEMKGLNSGPVTPALGADTIPILLGSDAELVDNPPLDTLPKREIADLPHLADGIVTIEDYTYDGSGLKNLKKALANRNSKPARIAMIGDSYIEGDIITMDLRDKLQETYGGRGVGYVAAHNIVQGFRTSLRHNDNGWTQHPISKIAGSKYMCLAGEYYTGNNGASVSLKGVDKSPRLTGWNNTRLLFIAPANGKITVAADSTSHTFDIEKAPGVQSVVLPAETSAIKVTSTIPGLILLGVWLEDNNGVVLDNMSVRGDSGISRKYVNVSLSRQMGQWVDYDLIIVEYGINALTSKQTDYTQYSNVMVDVLQRLRQSYPNADILLMGIGDRGQKIHGEPHSFPTAPNMVEAQRQAAKTAGVLFWDTREAMGGDDAIVRWREQKLANADYIHLNHDGGKRLGELLFQSINHAIKN